MSAFYVNTVMVPLTMLAVTSIITLWMSPDKNNLKIGLNILLLLVASFKAENINNSLPFSYYTKASPTLLSIYSSISSLSDISCHLPGNRHLLRLHYHVHLRLLRGVRVLPAGPGRGGGEGRGGKAVKVHVLVEVKEDRGHNKVCYSLCLWLSRTYYSQSCAYCQLHHLHRPLLGILRSIKIKLIRNQ